MRIDPYFPAQPSAEILHKIAANPAIFITEKMAGRRSIGRPD